MSQEITRIRAQYLNGVAVAAVAGGFSAVIAGAPLWVLLPAAATSVLIHCLAVKVAGAR